MKKTIAIDLGGTKLAAAIVDEQGNIHLRKEISTECTEREKLYHSMADLIRYLMNEYKATEKDFAGIGIGVPGLVDEKRGIAVFQNNLPWKNYPLRERLLQEFSFNSIIINNDVSMATIAEWEKNVNSKKETLVYMTISTGIACKIMYNGQILPGAGFTGEVGMLPISFPQSNKITDLENIASGPAISRRANDRIDLKERDNLSTKDVFQLADEGHEICIEVINDSLEAIAYTIYSIICMNDPHHIVLGGGVINNNPEQITVIQQKVDKLGRYGRRNISNRIKPSFYQQDAGLIGAAFSILKYKKN